MWRDKGGFFHPNSPLANDAGMAAMTAQATREGQERALPAPDITGERTVVLAAPLPRT